MVVPFFEIPNGDRLAKNVKSLCVQVIPRSTDRIKLIGFKIFQMFLLRVQYILKNQSTKHLRLLLYP